MEYSHFDYNTTDDEEDDEDEILTDDEEAEDAGRDWRWDLWPANWVIQSSSLIVEYVATSSSVSLSVPGTVKIWHILCCEIQEERTIAKLCLMINEFPKPVLHSKPFWTKLNFYPA